jgi:hypothetical protein
MDDDKLDELAERREQLIRRMCEVMCWEYSTSPVWSGLRKVALAEAVPVGLDKLEHVIDRLSIIPDLTVACQRALNCLTEGDPASQEHPESPYHFLWIAIAKATGA